MESSSDNTTFLKQQRPKNMHLYSHIWFNKQSVDESTSLYAVYHN